MNSWNPIRRTPLRKQPKKANQSMPWRRPKVRLDANGMKELRQSAFARSGGQCENAVDGQRCPSRISWMNSNLAHIIGRGRGGSDSLENTLMTCWECHDADTKNRRKLVPHQDWIAAA